jgi:hypothetical protein
VSRLVVHVLSMNRKSLISHVACPPSCALLEAALRQLAAKQSDERQGGRSVAELEDENIALKKVVLLSTAALLIFSRRGTPYSCTCFVFFRRCKPPATRANVTPPPPNNLSSIFLPSHSHAPSLTPSSLPPPCSAHSLIRVGQFYSARSCSFHGRRQQ